MESISATPCDALDDDGERVRVTFESGSPRDFDLVVGADGLHSRVRRLAFGPDEQFEKYLGIVVAAFEVDGIPPARRTRRHDARRGRLPGDPALAPRRRDAVPVHPRATAARCRWTDPADQQALLRASSRDAGWETPAILDAMPRREDFYFDR